MNKAALRKLQQKEVLEQTETGEIRFQVPLVQQFIERAVREEI